LEREGRSIHQNQVQLRGRKWEQIAEEFRGYFSPSSEWLTMKHRMDWVVCVDRNRRLAVHPLLPHILDVLQGVMEFARQERQLFGAHTAINQPREPTFPESISKSKKLEGPKSRYCFKTKRINPN
jgi:hypothetical protein